MKKRERIVYILLLALGLGAASFAIFGADGVPEVRRLQGEIDSLRQEIEALEDERTRLVTEVELLKNDPKTIERIAREELKMVRKDETVILLNDGGTDEK